MDKNLHTDWLVAHLS